MKDDAEHPDVERALDPDTVAKLDTAWQEEHAWKFISHMRPAPPFRNRVFREFRTQACKLIPVEKVKSLDEHKATA